MNRMLIRLYLPSILLTVGAVTASYVLYFFIPGSLSGNELFSGLAQSAMQAAPWVGVLMLGIALCSAAISTYRIQRWENGRCSACYTCGGITDYKVGKYGAYYKCLACGNNRSIQ